jgi:antirestriction protein ArdC
MEVNMVKKSKRDYEAEITNKVIAQLEAGVAPWRKSWATGEGLALRENGQPYRGYNQFILSMSGYASPFWFTYNKAAELSGCKKNSKGKWIWEDNKGVRENEKGTAIHFFKPLAITDKDTGEDKKIPLMKFYSVFNAEQIDGLPEKFFPKPVERTEVERDAGAEEYIKNIPAAIRHGGGSAFYSPSTDFIQVPDASAFDSMGDYYSTVLHELAHWTGHKTRLDRDLRNSFGTKDYSREELIAEASSAIICAHLGLEAEPREDHASYIKEWLSVLKEDKTALRKAFAKAQKVVDFLDTFQVLSNLKKEAA